MNTESTQTPESLGSPHGSPAFCARLHEALHAAITDPALRITIYRIVENLDKEGTSIFWDSDEHRIEFVGNGWALEFHQENDQEVAGEALPPSTGSPSPNYHKPTE